MNGIQMAGLDHSHANLQLRERFAFTKQAAEAAMQRVVEEFHAEGCVLLSTCNRTELWLSGAPEDCDPAALLCRLKGFAPEDPAWSDLPIACRSGRDAVRWLLRTAAGLESRVFGEDQIVTQVGHALALSRGCAASGSVLERLFRTAVTAAKRVKTTVRLTARDCSAATRAVDLLKEDLGPDLTGLACLVIGSGEMGRLAARSLLDEGCHVTMTLRSYAGHAANLPVSGCATLPYEDRHQALAHADVILSATTSPHHTLSYEAAAPLLYGRKHWLIDLAVPRDLDARLGTVPGVMLYDIDSMSGVAARDEAATEQAQNILAEYESEFEDWYRFRALVPAVRRTGWMAANDLACRMDKALRGLDLPDEMRETLRTQLLYDSEKVVEKLLFGLRDQVDRDLWQPCVEGLERAAKKVPAEFANRMAAPEPPAEAEKEETA